MRRPFRTGRDRARHAFRIVAALALAGSPAGCFTFPYTPGYRLEQAFLVLGTPSTVATVSGETFYYISQKSQRTAFMNPEITDQRVLAVYFDQNRRVERLANYGMQDGKVFDFISRTTATGG